MECSFYSTLVFNMCSAALRVKWDYFKVMTQKPCHNVNFENGGTTIQVSILHVLSCQQRVTVT